MSSKRPDRRKLISFELIQAGEDIKAIFSINKTLSPEQEKRYLKDVIAYAQLAISQLEVEGPIVQKPDYSKMTEEEFWKQFHPSQDRTEPEVEKEFQSFLLAKGEITPLQFEEFVANQKPVS